MSIDRASEIETQTRAKYEIGPGKPSQDELLD